MGTHAFSPQRAESFRHILLLPSPHSTPSLRSVAQGRLRLLTTDERGLAHPFRIKSQIQRLPRPCPCVLCRDRAGNLTWHPQLMEIKIPALSQRRDKSGAPSRIKMRKGWASPPQSNFGPQRLRKESSFALQPLKGRLISKDLRHR